MKKIVAVLLALMLSLACLSAFAETAKDETVNRLILLNNAFDGMETSKQRYNAYWLNCWNFGEVAAANFWFPPAADEKASVTAYTDYYTVEDDTFESMSAKFLSLGFDESYDVVCGPTQKMNAAVQYMGYILSGHEGLLFMPEDGWEIPDLFECVEMAAADAYTFEAADGYTVDVDAAQLDQCSIAYVDDRIDGVLPGMGDYTLYDIRAIYPAGLTKDSEAPDGVCHLTIFANAEGVYDTDAPHITNFGGTLYDAYSVKDLLDKYAVAACEEVKIVSYKDGYSKADKYENFIQKYITITSPKGTHPFTLGQVQPRNDGVQNAGWYVLSQDAFYYLPEESADVAFTDLFAGAAIMREAASYTITCADGDTHTVTADQLKDCFVGWKDGAAVGILPGVEAPCKLVSIQTAE